MQAIEIKLDGSAVDHGAKHAEDWAAVSVPVLLKIDGREFNLTFQAITSQSFEAVGVVDLDSACSDDKDALYEYFDYVDDDGDPMSGEYSDTCIRIVAIAQGIAQAAFDDFFAQMD